MESAAKKTACIPRAGGFVPRMDSSDFKGCAAPSIGILVMIVITCVMEIRRRERAELHLLKVLDSVQTDLEKGRVRQALDTLHVEFHNIEVSE